MNAIDIDLPSAAEKLDTLMWQPYEDINLPVSPSALHPMKSLLFVQQVSKLSQLTNDINLNLYAPKERFTPRRLAAAYHQYQNWYNNLPEPFHLQNTAMPHVIVLHMHYHMCILHLFRPFMKLDLQVTGLYPQNVCTYCATEISSLMNALRGITIHLLNLPSSTASIQLSQGIRDLQAMSVNHRYAGSCIEIIQRLAIQWGVALPEMAMKTPSFRSSEPQNYTATQMSGFYTQATLSNESIDSLAAASHGMRHDSGNIFEPSFTTHNFPILPQQQSNDSSSKHSLQGTPMHTTPVQPAQAMWAPFPPQHQVQGSNMQPSGYQMMNDLAHYSFDPYQPSG
ncbi:hypothetical protein MBLNU459_g6237t2 [Dothideomycetes sp. NU459]